jgi:hypothetical protein
MLLTSFNLQAMILLCLIFFLCYVGGFYLLYKIYLQKIIEEKAAQKIKLRIILLVQFYIIYALSITLILEAIFQ